MNIVDKVSKFNKTQKFNPDDPKPQTDPNGVNFADVKKNLSTEVKNKLFELSQKYGGIKEVIIYNLMKRHEFKYNLVENEAKLLAISKRNFSNHSTLAQSIDKKRASKDEAEGQIRERPPRKDTHINQSHINQQRRYENQGDMSRNVADRDYKDHIDKPKEVHSERNVPKEGNLARADKEDGKKYISQRNYGGSNYRGDRYQPYSDKGYGYNSNTRPQNNNYTLNYKQNPVSRGRGYGRNNVEGRFVSNRHQDHEDFEYVQKTEPKTESVTELPDEQKPVYTQQRTEPVLNEEEDDEISEDREYSVKLGLFAEPKSGPSAHEAKRALEKIMTVIESNMIYFLGVLKDYQGVQKTLKSPENDKQNVPQTVTPKAPADSRYKKKALEVEKEFKNELEVSSTKLRTNKVDLLIKKKFESEEEKLKSTREKKLEQKVKDLAEIINTMQMRINTLENVVRNKEGSGHHEGPGFQSNMYCMVPFHMVKDLISPVNVNETSNVNNGPYKCYTLNANDS